MADTDILVSEMTPASQINTTDLMIMTQPDAQAETGYSTKSGTVLQVANKMLKGTEYSTDLPDFTDKTPLGGLEELKADIKALLPIGSASGNPCNFETGIADTLVSLTANILASGGNGTPATPIPIVGHSELNLVRCGVNLWDEEMEIGTLSWADGTEQENNSRMRFVNFVPINEDTNYKIICPSDYDIIVYDANKNHLASYYNAGNIVFSVPTGGAYIKITTQSSYGTTYNHDIGIMYPSSVSAYAPYNGTPYLVSFGQTVYGGVYDANRGKVTVTHKLVDLGSMDWTYDSAYPRFYIDDAFDVDPYVSVVYDMISDIYAPVSWSNFSASSNYTMTFAPSKKLNIKNTDYSSASAFKTAMSGHQVAYKLATPIEIDVSELSVNAIVGTNNITSDCGGDVSVQYRDSIQHYIDKKIAETQALIL